MAARVLAIIHERTYELSPQVGIAENINDPHIEFQSANSTIKFASLDMFPRSDKKGIYEFWILAHTTHKPLIYRLFSTLLIYP